MTVTSAAAITAPLGSVTAPLMVALPACPYAGITAGERTTAMSKQRLSNKPKRDSVTPSCLFAIFVLLNDHVFHHVGRRKMGLDPCTRTPSPQKQRPVVSGSQLATSHRFS